MARAGTIATAIALFCLAGGRESLAQSLPKNVTVADERLRPMVLGLLGLSSTFRTQAAAIGRAEGLTVVLCGSAEPSSRHVRTQFLPRPDDTTALIATIEVPAGSPPEMLAHAFEHVMEHVARRNPLHPAAAANRVFRRQDGMFETSRALEVEQTVRREIARASPLLRELLFGAQQGR